MKDTDTYMTISSPSEGIFRDRGSRFMAFAYPASTPEACMEQLEMLRRKYRDARHHCFAYRLNPEGEIYRYSDDGEPSGTAGRPVYEQILSKGLFNVHIVVVRYFGGILLGTGGLHQAYKKAAAAALSHARIIESEITRDVEILFQYSAMNQVMQWIARENLKMAKKEFTDSGRIIIRVRKSVVEETLKKLRALHGTRVSVLK